MESPVAILISGDYILVEAPKLSAILSQALNQYPLSLREGRAPDIDFTIVAFAVFLLVKAVNRMKRKESAPAVSTTKTCPECLMAIPIEARRCGHCTTKL